MQSMPTQFDLGAEQVAPGEDQAIRDILARSIELVDTSRRPVPRGQHPKHHGCVVAEFIVEPDLPAELRHGLFREPRTYTALIRFSNGKETDDRKGDIHGMAIKLLDVPGEKLLESEKHATTHDFILADGPVFFIRDLAEYAPFAAGLARAKASKLYGAFFLLKVILFHRRTFGLLRAALRSIPTSPLRERYWSQTPYRLGPYAVKYSAVPDLALVPQPSASDSPDRLRLALAAHLERGEAWFSFEVQLQSDPHSMPVEDPTVEWSEKASPFRRVATLRIPTQCPDTPERMAYCENLSYNPWHALPEHRPLGGVNRARRHIYEAISERRHARNNVPRVEPTLADLPPDLRASTSGVASDGLSSRSSHDPLPA